MRIIAGEARGRRILSPRDRSVRPPLDRIRESVFSILGDAVEGGGVLDLFAGTGSFGLEALSRGATRAVFVENARSSLEILQRNLELTGFGPRAEVLRGDALRVPELGCVPRSTFGLVFLDPPFGIFDQEGPTREVVARVVEILRSRALRPGGSVILRCPPSSTDAVNASLGAAPAPDATTPGTRAFRAHPPRVYGESVVFHFQSAAEGVR